MILPFSTHYPKSMGEWAGQPNNFIEKIWTGLHHEGKFGPLERISFDEEYKDRFGSYWDGWYTPETTLPKLHTFREDRHNRWKPGMLIHPVINHRSKDQFQFAPAFACTAIQYVTINYGHGVKAVSIGNNPDYSDCVPIYFENDDDDSVHGLKEMQILAQNDGFESVDHFFSWFNKEWVGKIIHWSDVRY